jgi:methylenetetrahydrofolate reductase (NADPH)
MLRTADVTEVLAARGFRVIPHLSARMVTGPEMLDELVARLIAVGVDQVFVIGGDASPPRGPYHEALTLLRELEARGRPFATVGVGGYPEGHPLIPSDELLRALQRKQQYADHIVTQLCFDADALATWAALLRRTGVTLPIVVGLPGVVDRRRLAEISLKAGVGASLRYLRKYGRQMATLARSSRYDPTQLSLEVATRLDQAGLPPAGAHLFTFNQVGPTASWVARAAGV